MNPDEVKPVEATILGTRVSLYFFSSEDEQMYQRNRSFAAAINKGLEEAIRRGMTIVALGPILSGGRMSILRIIATNASGERRVKETIAEYRNAMDRLKTFSEENCEICDEKECPAYKMLHGDWETADGFSDEEIDPDLPGAPNLDAIRWN